MTDVAAPDTPETDVRCAPSIRSQIRHVVMLVNPLSGSVGPRAAGEAEAILTVFDAIHKGDPDPKLLGYQYLQMLPQLAEGASNKLWIVPSELTEALKGIGRAFTPTGGGDASGSTRSTRARCSTLTMPACTT